MCEAIIGVVGTIAGTILGWVLNELSSRGKLHMYITSWKEEFYYEDATMHEMPSSCIEQSRLYNYQMSAEIYNSSSSPRIMRDIKIVFKSGKAQLKEYTPSIRSTTQYSGCTTSYSVTGSINIPPKTVLKFDLHGNEPDNGEDLDCIWKSKSVFLTYVDEHNKVKPIKIKDEDYSHYFDKIENRK